MVELFAAWLVDGASNYCSTLIIPTNKWSFVGIVRSPGALSYYVNGSRETDTDEPNADTVDLPNAFLIGAESHSGIIEDFFDGSIDDIRYYNRALGPHPYARSDCDGRRPKHTIDWSIKTRRQPHRCADLLAVAQG
jgi:hypothetical protein